MAAFFWFQTDLIGEKKKCKDAFLSTFFHYIFSKAEKISRIFLGLERRGRKGEREERERERRRKKVGRTELQDKREKSDR